MTPIPFCDLSRAHAPIRGALEKAMSACLDRSSFLRGPETQAFEVEWAAYCGQAHAVCCNSGTDALTLAAVALNLKTAVIPANTLPLTGIGLHRGGASVRIGEIGPDGWLANSGPDDVPVLVFGRIPPQGALPARLYDAAHAHGWKQPHGSAAAWSFYPTKTLGALGDAGAITTNDAALAEEIRHLCGRDDQLRDRRQITSRIDEVQAAVLRVKLRHLDLWLAQRKEIAGHYDARLSAHGITLPGETMSHLYVIRATARDDLAAWMKARGIGTKLHWGTPLNQVPGPWIAEGTCPMAENWGSSVLSLPCFPGLRTDEVDRICDAVDEWFDRKAQ